MTEIERYQQPRSAIDLAPDAWGLAHKIAGTDFVPQAMRGKPDAVLACMLTGHELGIGQMQSLTKIHVVKGRPALSSELMRALVIGAGHELVVSESSTTRCTVRGRREGSAEWSAFSWTLDDAKRAGLASKENWRAYPAAMLLARASAMLCRSVFPDVLAGLSYSVEEIQDGFDEAEPELAEVKVERVPPPNRRRVKRAAVTSEPVDQCPDLALPDDDDPVEEAEIVDDDEDGQPSYTGPQLIAMKLQDLGQKDRSERLATVGAIIGRTIETTKDLSHSEVGEVLDILAELKPGDTLPGDDATQPEPPPFEGASPPAEAPGPDRQRRKPVAAETPDDWTAEQWRKFCKTRNMRAVPLLAEAARLAAEISIDPPATLGAIAGSGLAIDLVEFVEDSAI